MRTVEKSGKTIFRPWAARLTPLVPGRWVAMFLALVVTAWLSGCKASNAPTAAAVVDNPTPTKTSIQAATATATYPPGTNTPTWTPTATATSATGPTALRAGDVAFVAFAARHNDPNGVNDQFAAVILKNINAGTTITFTTANWSGTALAKNEAQIYWTAGRAYSAGAVFEVFNGGTSPIPVTVFDGGTAYDQTGHFMIDNGTLAGGFGLSKTGDNIFAIQGTNTSPTFLAGLIFKISWGGDDGNGTDALPPGLTDGVSSISIGGYSTGRYNCTNYTGTSAQLAAYINNVSYWTDLQDKSNTDLSQSGDVLSCTMVVP